MVLFSFLVETSHAQISSVSPVHGWLMGPATLHNSGNSSCVVFNQFSDGTGLRFNIKNERIETMTLVFSELMFDPSLSVTYKTLIETTGNFKNIIDGHAYSPNILTITPADGSLFFMDLKKNPQMTVSIPRQNITFNLRNIAESLDKTSSCNGETQATKLLPEPVKQIHIFADLTLPRRKILASQTTWRASKGELLSGVVKRWSLEGGREIKLGPIKDQSIPIDFLFQGSQDDAFKKLFETMNE